MNKRKTTIYIVDDHQMFIDGLKALLKIRVNIEIVGHNLSALKAIPELKELRPDILITDISMPEMSGVELTRLIRKHLPNTLILCLSMHKDMSYINEMMEAGANAYLLKNTGVKELFLAIDSILEGEIFYAKEVKEIIVNQHIEQTALVKGNSKEKKSFVLTRREREIISYIIKGHAAPDIADILQLSYYTITTHKKNIYTKLGVSKTSELIEYVGIHPTILE